MEGQNNEPIIIKKGKKGGHGHHGGAWKVAYADFVTAMMALFIVLWILGQSEEVKEQVANYFKNPFGVGVGQGSSPLQGGPRNPTTDVNDIIRQKEMERQALKSMGDEIIKELSVSPEFQQIIDQIQAEITDEGLKIEVMDTQEDAFFEVGTSTLKPSAYKMLQVIGKELSKLNNRVVIEGHTDARPYSSTGQGYSNFELSSDRANAARRALIAGGLLATQIEQVRGWADNKLKLPDEPYSEKNRRISIIVKFKN